LPVSTSCHASSIRDSTADHAAIARLMGHPTPIVKTEIPDIVENRPVTGRFPGERKNKQRS
jgi:hypothetical protein